MAEPRKHGRDHLPSGYAAVVQAVSDPADLLPEGSADQLRTVESTPSGGLTVPWARLGGGAATVPNDTWTNLDFAEAMSYNEVAAGFGAGDIFQLEDQGDRFRITLDMDGLYLIHGTFAWDDTFDEFRAVDLQQSLGDHLYNEGYGLTTFSGPFATTGGPFFNVDTISSFVFKSSSVNSPDPRIDPRAYQSSGVDRGCSGFSVRIMYLGPIGAEASWIYQTT